MENWRAKRKAEREDFESTMATLTDTFTSTMASNSQTMGTLAAQRALDRLNAATAKKQADQAKADSPSGFSAMENISARYRDLAVSTAVDIST
jgi:hypothetical protein